MEFQIRCNSLKCRTALNDRAVVTTCSHIFCLTCSDSLGLTDASGVGRTCPACESPLANLDDAVETRLNPTEDCKTSVLSGLSPIVIMECASRGLNFYSYQTTQEIIYQDFLAKSLREKNDKLHSDLNNTVHNADHELARLHDKIQTLQLEQQALEKKNMELANAFRAKAKAHGQLRQMYTALKQQQLAGGIELAAEHDAENALNRKQFAPPGHPSGRSSRTQTMPLHGRAGSNGSGGGGSRQFGVPGSRSGIPGIGTASYSHTPSHHRTYLGGPPRGPQHAAGIQATPRRMPMQSLEPNVYGNPNAAGYVAMGSTAKAARQQGGSVYRGPAFGASRSPVYSILNAR